MMDWNGDWSWATWLLMSLSMLAFWGLVAWVAVTLLRSSRPAGTDRAGDADGRQRKPPEVVADVLGRKVHLALMR